MLTNATLYTLARAVDVGILDSADTSAARFDPFLRGAIRRRVRRALAAAAAATTINAEREGEVHRLKLAFLCAAERMAGIDANDMAAVAAAYAPLAARHPMRRGARLWPVVATLVALAVAALGVGAALFFWPTPEESFRKTALGKALAEPLTKHVIAMAQQKRPGGTERLAKTRADVLTPAVQRQIGEDATIKLGDVLLAAANLVSASPDMVDEQSKRLDASLSDLNLTLAKR